MAVPTKAELIERVRALAPAFAKRADAAEQARRMPAQSVREMLDVGLTRILMPERFGGYGLDFDAWNDVVLEISKSDASHGWCASLLIHHAHLIAQYPQACRTAPPPPARTGARLILSCRRRRAPRHIVPTSLRGSCPDPVVLMDYGKD